MKPGIRSNETMYKCVGGKLCRECYSDYTNGTTTPRTQVNDGPNTQSHSVVMSAQVSANNIFIGHIHFLLWFSRRMVHIPFLAHGVSKQDQTTPKQRSKDKDQHVDTNRGGASLGGFVRGHGVLETNIGRVVLAHFTPILLDNGRCGHHLPKDINGTGAAAIANGHVVAVCKTDLDGLFSCRFIFPQFKDECRRVRRNGLAVPFANAHG